MMLGSYSVFLKGFSVGASLIIAIGAQNAFVLKHGLKRRFIFWVCLVCALSDSILIFLGVQGFATLIQQYPHIIQWSRYLGAGFLCLYGLMSFYRAFKNQHGLAPSEFQSANFSTILLTCLALTWLNPHVYLDTVILMGSISTQFAEEKMTFALGAMTASWLFFYALGYGARFLQPIFAHVLAWRILDFFIALMMWWIAYGLIFSEI